MQNSESRDVAIVLQNNESRLLLRSLRRHAIGEACVAAKKKTAAKSDQRISALNHLTSKEVGRHPDPEMLQNPSSLQKSQHP